MIVRMVVFSWLSLENRDGDPSAQITRSASNSPESVWTPHTSPRRIAEQFEHLHALAELGPELDRGADDAVIELDPRNHPRLDPPRSGCARRRRGHAPRACR